MKYHNYKIKVVERGRIYEVQNWLGRRLADFGSLKEAKDAVDQGIFKVKFYKVCYEVSGDKYWALVPDNEVETTEKTIKEKLGGKVTSAEIFER